MLMRCHEVHTLRLLRLQRRLVTSLILEPVIGAYISFSPSQHCILHKRLHNSHALRATCTVHPLCSGTDRDFRLWTSNRRWPVTWRMFIVMGHMIMTKNSSSTGCPLKTTSSTWAAGTSTGLQPMTCTHHPSSETLKQLWSLQKGSAGPRLC